MTSGYKFYQHAHEPNNKKIQNWNHISVLRTLKSVFPHYANQTATFNTDSDCDVCEIEYAVVKQKKWICLPCHMMCVLLKNLKSWASSHFWCIQWARWVKNCMKCDSINLTHFFDICWILSLAAVWKSDRKSVEKPQTELFIHDFDMKTRREKIHNINVVLSKAKSFIAG